MMAIQSLNDDERADRRQHVAPPDVEARCEAVWQRLQPRLRGQRPRKGRMPGLMISLGLAAAAAAGLVLVLHRAPRPSAPVATPAPSTALLVEGARLRANAQASHLSLPDGSKVVADSFSDLELLALRPDQAAFRLRQGRASFDVVPNPKRKFSVQAGPVHVEVLGTAFSVARSPSQTSENERVEISVVRGVVAVVHGNNRRKLQAGESYAVEEPVGEAALPVAHPPHTKMAPKPQTQRPPDRAVPKDLAAVRFQAATNARLAQKYEEAAKLYEAFLLLHPQDQRASLVAFELGRTRMDELGDPARAISALERSLRLGPQSPFREDALARLVRLHEAQGQLQACLQAQRTYVREHPQGRMIEDVRQRCAKL